MKNLIVITWQLISYFLVGVPLKIIHKTKPIYNFKYENGHSYIIASNHPSKIDPFLVCYNFPFKDFIRLIPFRFVTADKFLHGFNKYFLLLYGCFSTKEVKGKKVLERAKHYLERGETVYIFPTGRIEKSVKYKPKVGTIYLQRDINNCKIIPVNLTYKDESVKITYKKSFRYNQFNDDLQPLAGNLMEKILNE